MALTNLKKLLGTKKAPTPKTRVLTAEGWKRRFTQKNAKAKKTAKK